MSGLAIAFAIWAALMAFASLIMNLARTPPDVASSNLSLWAKRVGLFIPGWLKTAKAYEVVFRWAKLSRVALIIIGTIAGLYFLYCRMTVPASLPPIPVADQEVSGLLKPANEQTPPNGCDRHPNPDAMKVLIGDNAISDDRFGKLDVLEIGSCKAIVMERYEGGIAVSASVYDEKGSQNVVKITKNKVVTLNGENYTSRITDDGSALTVKRNQGDVLLFIKYINRTTMLIQGTFGCSAKRSVVIQNNAPISG